MNNKILALIAGVIIFYDAFSQETKKFRIGLKVVPSAAWLKSDMTSLQNNGFNFKFSYGMVSEFGISDNISIATGVEVNNSGGVLQYNDTAKYILTGSNGQLNPFLIGTRQYKLQYVELPITLKMKTKEIGYFTYWGQFGANLGIRTKVRALDKKYVSVNSGAPNPGEQIVTDDIQLFRVALNIGGGIEYNLAGSTSLLLGINFNNGFTNVLKNPSELLTTPNGLPYKQQATSKYIALTVGILF